MENNILLSICIPTYNGAKKLQQCLTNITCQLKDPNIKNAIEVVVSDNASADNTTQVVKKFQENFDNIKYFKNETNIGFDENTINSVAKANGKYCWHIGDDDFIQNGVLKFLVDFLSKSDPTLLTVEYHSFIDVDKSLKEDTNITQEKNIILHSGSPEEFWTKGYCEGTLGVFISNRALWLAMNRKNYEKRCAYYEIILKMMKVSDVKLAHFNYPAFYMGQDYTWQKKGGGFFTYIDWVRVLRKLEGFGYEKNFIKQLAKITTSNFPMVLLDAKNNDLPWSFFNLKLMYKELYQYPIQLFFATIIFFIPNSLIKMLKSVRNKLLHL